MTEFTPKRKKLLTRPVLKLEQDKPVYVKIEIPMFIGKVIKKKDEEDDKEPATIINCIDLTSGEPVQIVANAVLKSVLREEYPEESYVGKCFSVTKQSRQPGKRYNPFHIEEIEDPTVAAKEEQKPHVPEVSQSKKK
jgi:hypothetical protein